MKKKANNKKIIIAVLIVLLLALAIGYAAFSDILTISGTANAKGTFDLEFQNAEIVKNVGADATKTTAVISEDKNTLTVNVADLSYPGSGVEFAVDIVNVGTIPAEVQAVTPTNITGSDKIKVTGLDVIKTDHPKIEAGDKCNIHFTVEWPADSGEILENESSISFGLQIEYTQSTGALFEGNSSHTDTDKNGNPTDDIDSTPGNNKDGEDDIDIEKVKVKYFDLALKKWVSQVIIIENGKQTVTPTGHTGNENPEPDVKVDLKDKKLNSVTVKFAYKVKVTNEGQIAGYVKELKDYIPAGLRFVAADNPDWKQVSDNVVATTKLENTLLKPGESASVDIILTWINGDNNLGKKVNIAEISKDYNDSHTPDIDSTPDNFKDGEDDIDDAPVILSIKTGEATIYFTLGIIMLVTVAGGIILIKKYVL